MENKQALCRKSGPSEGRRTGSVSARLLVLSGKGGRKRNTANVHGLSTSREDGRFLFSFFIRFSVLSNIYTEHLLLLSLGERVFKMKRE